MTPINSFLQLINPALGALGDACTLPKHSFFFLPPWWEYIQPRFDELGNCVVSFSDATGKFQIMNVWMVGLAVLDMLLRIAGFVAVISIIIAGFQLQFSGGNAEKASSARRRVLNSIYGLLIALIATALVTFIGDKLGG